MNVHASSACYNFKVSKRRQIAKDQLSLPFLIHRIARRLENDINATAKDDGLKIEGIRILLRLLRSDHQRVGQLAIATSIEQSALSHMLKRMQADGFVTRGKAVDDDSRTTLVSLTMRGRRMAQKYAPRFKEIDEAWLAGLTRPDRHRLKQMLTVIYERLLNAESQVVADESGASQT